MTDVLIMPTDLHLEKLKLLGKSFKDIHIGMPGIDFGTRRGELNLMMAGRRAGKSVFNEMIAEALQWRIDELANQQSNWHTQPAHYFAARAHAPKTKASNLLLSLIASS